MQATAVPVSPNFIRKANLLVGKGENGIDMSHLQFNFAVKMADINNPQFANVRIYNVSDDTRNTIKTNEYDRLTLQAGYQNGQFGMIFDGEIIQGRAGRESAVDTYIDLLAAVGYSANQAGINTTLAAGSSRMDVAKAAAGAMGVTLNSSVPADNVKLPRGQVLYGMARETLRTAANSMDASWFHDNDGARLVPMDSYVPGEPIVLNASTGLIGWPEQTQEGIRIRCLLNPRISVATLIQLDNRSIQRAAISPSSQFVNTFPNTDPDGLYRVLYFEHSGDTRGQDWYTDVIAISVHQTADGGITSLYQRGLP